MKPTLSDFVAQVLLGKTSPGDALLRTAIGDTYIQFDSVVFTVQGDEILIGLSWKGALVAQWGDTFVAIPSGTAVSLDGIEGRMKLTLTS